MPRTPFGLIKSLDRGRSWHKLGLEGESDFHMLAASHGTNAVYVFNLLPNSRMRQVGLHYTLDDGRTWKHAEARSFERLVGGRQVLAVSFDLDGEKFWFSSVASRAKLWRIGLKAGGRAQRVKLSELGEDAVAYLAQHPQRRGEIAIATFRRSVYLSPDQGGRWTQIAKEGPLAERPEPAYVAERSRSE